MFYYLRVSGRRRAHRVADGHHNTEQYHRYVALNSAVTDESPQGGMGKRDVRFPDLKHGLFLRSARRGPDALSRCHQGGVRAYRSGHSSQHHLGAYRYWLDTPVVQSEK